MIRLEVVSASPGKQSQLTSLRIKYCTIVKNILLIIQLNLVKVRNASKFQLEKVYILVIARERVLVLASDSIIDYFL